MMDEHQLEILAENQPCYGILNNIDVLLLRGLKDENKLSSFADYSAECGISATDYQTETEILNYF